jgi:hypothetical protein
VIFFFSPSSLFPRVRPVATVNASSSSTEAYPKIIRSVQGYVRQLASTPSSSSF